MTSLGLVVPVYDEEERLAEFGAELVAFMSTQPPGSQLLFVDDGSSDGTLRAIDELMATAPAASVAVLRRPHQGKGAALAAGIAHLTTDQIAFCDLDLSTPLAHLQRLVDVARRAPVLAIGSRDMAGSRLVRRESRLREQLGRTYNRLVQAAVAPGVVDTQCGAKAAAREVWAEILPHCREPGFAWDAEVVGVALARGVVVRELPVEWRHDDRSKVRVGRDGLRMVAATPRILASVARARRAPHPPAPAPGAGGPAVGHWDHRHWWFRSKAAVVATLLRRTGPAAGEAPVLLDVGAGAGGVTVRLGWDPTTVVAIERDAHLALLAARRHGLTACVADAENLPVPAGSAAAVCLLDVLEHLAEPHAALVEAHRALGPGGRLIVTVPAHRWLWSRADAELGHRRRYSRRGLGADLSAAGFDAVLASHVFSWLVVPAALTRRWGVERRLASAPRSRVVDLAVLFLAALERLLVPRLPLPLGTTIVAVARRRG